MISMNKSRSLTNEIERIILKVKRKRERAKEIYRSVSEEGIYIYRVISH